MAGKTTTVDKEDKAQKVDEEKSKLSQTSAQILR